VFSGFIKSSIVASSLIALTLTSAPAIMAKADRLSLGVINIGMTKAEVRKRLGRPLKSSYSHCGREHFTYSKGEVGTQDGFVYYVTTQNPNWRTKKGIKVGDSIVKAKKVYKLKKNAEKEFEVVSDDISPMLILEVNREEKIKRIRIWQPSVC
jgi:outer membrane protein assembly factor BamE (lipoprotein component of BamABCDE complex)